MTTARAFSNRLRRAATGILIATATAFAPAGAVHADDYVDQANKLLQSVPSNRHSDTVILPLLVKLESPPRAIASVDKAEILPAGATGWADAEAWAMKPSQRAVLEGIKSITQESDYRKAYVFAQPYGVDKIPVELIRARMYTELGDPPTVSAAQHLYLPKFDDAAVLFTIEATRLAAAGSVQDAIDVLTNWLYFSRSICDRAYFEEVRWGLGQMGVTYERIRDVAYGHLMNESRGNLDMARWLKQIQRLSDTGSYLELDRIKWPDADRIGAEQVLARVYIPRAGVNEAVFASTMSKLGSSSHPLRLFSEEAKWRNAATSQADWFQATEINKGVYLDWSSRWQVKWFDSQMTKTRAYDKMDKAKFAAIAQATPDMWQLFDLRHIARTEGVGTRTSLAHIGSYFTNKQFATVLSAVRPYWLPKLEADPFNPDRAAGGEPPLMYRVPMRDTPKGDGGVPKPYEVDIVPRDGGTTFGVKLTDLTFLLYSRGSDNADNAAKRIQNTAVKVGGADYIIFPPLLSLQRQHLIDKQELK